MTPDDVAAIFRFAMRGGQPFILTVNAEIVAVAEPPDYTLIQFDPPLSMTEDTMRALLKPRPYRG